MAFCRETDPNWDLDIGNDVKDEGEKFGPVMHHYVDKNSKVGFEKHAVCVACCCCYMFIFACNFWGRTLEIQQQVAHHMRPKRFHQTRLF